jgi:hypothetical protein
MGVAGACAASLFGLLAAVLVAFVLWYRWDSGQNHGWSFGYYGEFNTVSNALASSPGVQIVSSGYNADITLEEFVFTVRTSERKEVKVWFNEGDPVRRMTGPELTAALRAKIERESSNQQPDGIRR